MLFDPTSDVFRPMINTVVVGFVSTIIALLLGGSAAYALVRFNYNPRLGMIGLGIGTIAYIFITLAWPSS